MRYKIKLARKAKKDLEALKIIVQKRVVNKLKFYLKSGNPLQHAKKLKDDRLGEYRFRIGDYRIIFDIDKEDNINILIILRIKHRKEVYG